MSYQDLYLKYKTKYINLKYHLGGGVDSNVKHFIAKRISKKDKPIVDLALKNLDTNKIGIPPISRIDKDILTNIYSKGFDAVYHFMYSFLVEYGFNNRPGQINNWIATGAVSLFNVIDLLKLFEGPEGKGGIVERGHRAIYAAIIANMKRDEKYLNLSNLMFQLNLLEFAEYNIIIPEIEGYKETFVDYKIPPEGSGSLIRYMAQFFLYLFDFPDKLIDWKIELNGLLKGNKPDTHANIKLSFMLKYFVKIGVDPTLVVS
jgi:hypothetical protein